MHWSHCSNEKFIEDNDWWRKSHRRKKPLLRTEKNRSSLIDNIKFASALSAVYISLNVKPSKQKKSIIIWPKVLKSLTWMQKHQNRLTKSWKFSVYSVQKSMGGFSGVFFCKKSLSFSIFALAFDVVANYFSRKNLPVEWKRLRRRRVQFSYHSVEKLIVAYGMHCKTLSHNNIFIRYKYF